MSTLFEALTPTEDLSEWTTTDSAGASILATSSAAYQGSYGIRVNDLLYNGYYALAQKTLASKAPEFYFQIKVKIPVHMADNTTLDRLIHVETTSPWTDSVYIVLHRGTGNDSYYFTLHCLGVGTLGTSSTFTLSTNTWLTIEMYVLDSISWGNNGAVGLWLEGSQIIDVSGIKIGNVGGYDVMRIQAYQSTGNANLGYVDFDNIKVSTEYIGIAPASYYPFIQQVSNVDSVADIGIHSNFANQQTDDENYDTLTEANAGTPSTITRGATVSVWSTSSTTTGSSGTDFAHTVNANTSLLIVTIGMNSDESISSAPVWNGTENMTLIHATTSNNNSADQRLYTYGLVNPTVKSNYITFKMSSDDHAYAVAVNYIGTVNTSVADATEFLNEKVNNSGTTTTVLSSGGNTGSTLFLSANFYGGDGDPATNNADFAELADTATGTSTTYDDSFYVADKIGITKATAVTVDWYSTASDENCGHLIEILPAQNTNYRLELEEQFTEVPYGELTNPEIHVTTGDFSGESLYLQIWSGSSAWQTLGSVTANQDNTYNVSDYTTSADMYIRFLDGTTGSDSTQSTWQIKAVYLATGSSTTTVTLDTQFVIKPKFTGHQDKWLSFSPKFTSHKDEPIKVLPKFTASRDELLKVLGVFVNHKDELVKISPKLASTFEKLIKITPQFNKTSDTSLTFKPKYSKTDDSQFRILPKYLGIDDKLLKINPKYSTINDELFKVTLRLLNHSEAIITFNPSYQSLFENILQILPKYTAHAEALFNVTIPTITEYYSSQLAKVLPRLTWLNENPFRIDPKFTGHDDKLYNLLIAYQGNNDELATVLARFYGHNDKIAKVSPRLATQIEKVLTNTPRFSKTQEALIKSQINYYGYKDELIKMVPKLMRYSDALIRVTSNIINTNQNNKLLKVLPKLKTQYESLFKIIPKLIISQDQCIKIVSAYIGFAYVQDQTESGTSIWETGVWSTGVWGTSSESSSGSSIWETGVWSPNIWTTDSGSSSGSSVLRELQLFRINPQYGSVYAFYHRLFKTLPKLTSQTDNLSKVLPRLVKLNDKLIKISPARHNYKDHSFKLLIRLKGHTEKLIMLLPKLIAQEEALVKVLPSYKVQYDILLKMIVSHIYYTERVIRLTGRYTESSDALFSLIGLHYGHAELLMKVISRITNSSEDNKLFQLLIRQFMANDAQFQISGRFTVSDDNSLQVTGQYTELFEELFNVVGQYTEHKDEILSLLVKVSGYSDELLKLTPKITNQDEELIRFAPVFLNVTEEIIRYMVRYSTIFEKLMTLNPAFKYTNDNYFAIYPQLRRYRDHLFRMKVKKRITWLDPKGDGSGWVQSAPQSGFLSQQGTLSGYLSQSKEGSEWLQHEHDQSDFSTEGEEDYII